MKRISINLNTDKDTLVSLPPNSLILLTGDIYVMRDAAHKRYMEDLASGNPPFPIASATIYYMGPTPKREGEIIGSAGPTTSARMDDYAPILYDLKMLATIGKGERSKAVKDALARNNAVYLSAIGGAGALYQDCIKKAETIAYSELGAEACLLITVEDFPCIVKYTAQNCM